ncbi:unnamed protein product, partial [Iphiclides podalirius]
MSLRCGAALVGSVVLLWEEEGWRGGGGAARGGACAVRKERRGAAPRPSIDATVGCGARMSAAVKSRILRKVPPCRTPGPPYAASSTLMLGSTRRGCTQKVSGGGGDQGSGGGWRSMRAPGRLQARTRPPAPRRDNLDTLTLLVLH